MKEQLSKRFKKWIPDRRLEILRDERYHVGDCKESFEFFDVRRLPEPVRRLRQRAQSVKGIYDWRFESILLYKKELTVKTDPALFRGTRYGLMDTTWFNLMPFLNFITDSGMRGLGGCTNLTLAQELSKDKSVATYIYTFEDSTVPTSRKFADYDDAASHASELTYFFPDAGQYQARSVKMTEAQKVLAKEMRQYWGNFIKTQNPNGKSLPQWKRFSDDGGSMMALRLNGQSQSVPASYFSDLHQCKFWHSIPIVLDRGDR